jgi:hypothetical protein
MTKISFIINEQDNSGHIATISDIDFGNTEQFAQKLYKALTEHYDADVRFWSIPPSVFEYPASIEMTVANSFDTAIRIERTFIY